MFAPSHTVIRHVHLGYVYNVRLVENSSSKFGYSKWSPEERVYYTCKLIEQTLIKKDRRYSTDNNNNSIYTLKNFMDFQLDI